MPNGASIRNNQPVTQREFGYADDTALTSLTDTQGHVTCANAAFITLSRFEREEIVGKPHNRVRHADMPKVAFADRWPRSRAGTLGRCW